MENCMKKLFVGNLSWKTTEDQLKEHFESVGEVVSARIVIDQMTGKSKGFGFVEMADADAATTAINSLNEKPLLDRNLRVSLALERQDRPSQPRGGDRGGERGGERRERSYRGSSGSSSNNAGGRSHYNRDSR
jgi:RNA recognition motif-containing protein